MPDVANPDIYLAAVAAVLDEYPQAVRNTLSDPRTGTRLLKRYPDLFDIREACDKAYEPIERAIHREKAAESHRLALAAPSKPNEARRAEQFEDYQKRIRPVITSALQPILSARVERPSDSGHFNRIKADLELRRARNEAQQQAPPPSAA